jgi:HK97 family phage prohead protease
MPSPDTRRYAAAAMEVRISGDTATAEGHASTFDQWYDMGWYEERVVQGAFTKTLSESPDVRFLINHDGLPLARTTTGTLELAQDTSGLYQRAKFNMNRNDVRDAVYAMRDGDATQMSFGFRTIRDAWSEHYDQRSLTELSLQNGDVSLVTYPANPNATISVRARTILDADPDELRAAFAAIHEERAGKTISAATQRQLEAVLESLDSIDTANEDAVNTIASILTTDAPTGEPAARAGTPVANVRERLRLAGLSI